MQLLSTGASAFRGDLKTEIINSYTENAGVAGQNNKQVAAYADLGEAGCGWVGGTRFSMLQP